MQGELPEIARCPPKLLADALSLVLTDLAPSQRREVAASLLQVDDTSKLANEPLWVALRFGKLVGAAWGQRQSGNIAVFWPPRLVSGEDPETETRLAEWVVESLDDTGVEMTQTLVSPADEHVIRVLTHVNFRQLADLLYLTCEASRFAQSPPPDTELEFVTYDGTQRARLMRLIERSYESTLDCAALNGVRDVDNVVTGYQATGSYKPENWQLVKAHGEDVGVLLLADHPKVGHWELMYTGLIPEARGRGWGREVTQYAQWMANRAGVERIVLAVDSVNEPAIRVYRSSGFEIWDKRSVYVRFPVSKRV
jgi:ribosomal protein S18 acetylase RimI-like enzyme